MMSYDWSRMRPGHAMPERRHPAVDLRLREFTISGTAITAPIYNAALDLALDDLERSTDPEEREIFNAMECIRHMRARFSTETTSEAWRRLGGSKALAEWRERTKTMPNVTVEIDTRAVEESMLTAMKKLRSVVPAMTAAAATEVAIAAGCQCEACTKYESYPGRDQVDAAIIVQNLKHFKPAVVIAALHALTGAGVGGKCAFCGIFPDAGEVHHPDCVFSVMHAPMPAPAPQAPMPGYKSFGYVTKPGATAIPSVTTVLKKHPAVTAPAAKASLLNPPAKGFDGAASLPWDSDYD